MIGRDHTAVLFEQVLKFNPYHGKDGRFSTRGNASMFTYNPGKSTAHSKAIEREKKKFDYDESGRGFSGTLYHGSPNTDIKQFDMTRAGSNTSSGEKLLFFTDSKQMADDFSYERLPGSTTFTQIRGKKGRVYEVDVHMKKPLDFRNLSDKDIENILKLDIDGILTKNEVKRLASKNHQLLKTTLDLSSESLKELGYDGLIANTGKAGHNSLEYAVVSSSQAKIKKSIGPATFSEILKFNPYHDKLGRFSTSNGGGSVPSSISSEAQRTLKDVESKSILLDVEQTTIIGQDGNILLQQLGDKGSCRINFSNSEKIIEDAVLTHNHPSEYGGTFSDSDIKTFVKNTYELSSIRAVGKEGTYTLEKGESVNSNEFYLDYRHKCSVTSQKMKDAKSKMSVEMTAGKITMEEANERLKDFRTEILKQDHEYLEKIATSYGFRYIYEPSKYAPKENRNFLNESQKKKLSDAGVKPKEFQNTFREERILSGDKGDIDIDSYIDDYIFLLMF